MGKNKRKKKKQNTQKTQKAQVVNSRPSFIENLDLKYVFLSLIVIYAMLLSWTRLSENDTWWHLKLGQWMVDNKQFLRKEIFTTLVQGKDYLAYEWLAQVLFYFMETPKGHFLSFFKIITMGLTGLYFCYYFLKDHLNKSFVFPIVISFLYLYIFRAQVRPHLFGLCCTCFLLMALFTYLKDGQYKKLWWMIPTQIFWANTHGSFLLAPAITFYLAGVLFLIQIYPVLPKDKEEKEKKETQYSKEALFHLITFGFVLLLVSNINPYGFLLLKKSILVFFKHNYMREHINEWKSVASFLPSYWSILWFLWIGTCWGLLFKNKSKVGLIDVSFLGLATYFPFSGMRYVTLSVLLSFPVLCKYSILTFKTKINYKLSSILLSPIIIYLIFWGYPESTTVNREVGLGFRYSQVPLDIVQHIKSHKIKGTIMNHYNDGAYIDYYTYPEVKTVMDSRTDLYSRFMFENHHDAFTDWDLFQRYVSKHNINLIMNRIENQTLRQLLFKDPQWKLEKSGMNFDLFRKTNGQTDQPNLNAMLGLKGKNKLNLYSAMDDQLRYCIFVRLYGRCFMAPECDKECSMTDSEIALSLGLSNDMCLKFSQACLKKDYACVNCRSLCSHYRLVENRLQSELNLYHPSAPVCH